MVRRLPRADIRSATIGFRFLLAVGWLLLAGALTPVRCEPILFEGARLITGDGGAPIENSAFIMDGDHFTAVGRRGELSPPPGAARVDLSGRTVIPALIDAHVHMGYRRGLTFGPENYTRENLLDTLNRFAYYGVGAILETGTARGELAYQLRAELPPGALYRTAGRGFGMPNAGPGGPMRDSAYGVTTEEESRRDVAELAAKKVDMIKIWVDDRNGTVEKLKPNLYRAIIDEAHRHDIRVLAHIVDLADVKDLLRSGVDGLAHMIRDKDLDDEALALLKARPNVFFEQTLWGERRSIYASRPAWLDEPILRETFSAREIDLLGEEFTQSDSPQATRARAMGQTNLRNTARLNAAGVTLAVGTDSGGVTGEQFFGLGTHVEMEIQVTRAGLTPMQALVAGTRTAARVLGLERHGTIAPGMSADFIVLNANPLDNIANTRRIDRVYLRGQEVPRPALRAKWQTEMARGAAQ
jgi:imidazolonepropionase-like amidohydrolase